jgi:uncharacterized protein
MADNPDIELVKRGYEAFNNADIDTLSGMYADDAVHHVPGSHPLSGDKKGRDAILGYYGQLGEQTGGTFKADLQSVDSPEPGKVVVKHTASGTRGDKKLNANDTLTFTVKDGKFVDLDESYEDDAAANDFWS